MNVAAMEWNATIRIWAFFFHFGQLRGCLGSSATQESMLS